MYVYFWVPYYTLDAYYTKQRQILPPPLTLPHF